MGNCFGRSSNSEATVKEVPREQPKQQQQQQQQQPTKQTQQHGGKDEDESGWGCEEGNKWRAEADKEGNLMRECFSKSQEAFKSGDKAAAKQLSDEGKAHEAKMQEAQEKAAKAIFAHKNSTHDEYNIDLHGLLVQEAAKFLEERLDLQKQKGLDHLIVIYGAGNHSAGGVRKIKPEVEKILKARNLKFEHDNPNHGCCYVTL